MFSEIIILTKFGFVLQIQYQYIHSLQNLLINVKYMLLMYKPKLLRRALVNELLKILISRVLLAKHDKLAELTDKLNQLVLVVLNILRVKHTQLIDNQPKRIDPILRTQLVQLLCFGIYARGGLSFGVATSGLGALGCGDGVLV